MTLTHAKLGASVFLLALVTHLNSLGGGFHYDDAHSIVENHHLRSLANVPAYFLDPATFSSETAMAMYRPLVQTSYALTYGLAGYIAWPYLLFNVLLHGLVAVLVYLLIEQKTGWALSAWWAGALFAVHPMHSQVANYISSRSEALAVLGVFAALYWAGQGFPLRSASAYALGLLSKSVAIVCAPLLFLWQGRKTPRRVWAPVAALSSIYLMIIVGNQFLTRSFAQDVRSYGVQIYTQSKALVYYLYLMAFPVQLSIEHPLRASASMAEGPVILAVALLGSLVFVARRGISSAAGLGFGIFCLGFAIPFLWPLNVIVNEHRAYLPFFGLLYALVGSLGGRRPGITRAAYGLLLVFALMTWQRNAIWQDEYSLWSDAALKAPQSFRAQSNLGLAQYERGELSLAQKTLERAVGLNTNYARTWSNLGLVYEGVGDYVRSEEAYGRALRLRPDLVGARANLGRLYMGLHHYGEAIDQFVLALAADPHSVVARTNLGLAHQRAGRQELAVQEYERALQDGPLTAEAYNNLGLAYQNIGALDKAEQALQRALLLTGANTEAAVNLRMLQLRRSGRSPLEIYEALVREFPNRTEPLRGLAALHAERGRLEEAIAVCRLILSLDPRDQQAMRNLEKLLKSQREN